MRHDTRELSVFRGLVLRVGVSLGVVLGLLDRDVGVVSVF